MYLFLTEQPAGRNEITFVQIGQFLKGMASIKKSRS
tara:strand:- start:2694 stop:2801 length:108 start_codon:yes stop_codon:yes gene_type:complete